MSIEQIADAHQDTRVIVPAVGATGIGHSSVTRYHEPDGRMRAACGNWVKDGQLLERQHARAVGLEPCQTCFGGDEE